MAFKLNLLQDLADKAKGNLIQLFAGKFLSPHASFNFWQTLDFLHVLELFSISE